MPDTCTSCGAQIEWGITSKGRRMPIDTTPPGDLIPNIAVIGTFRNGTHAIDVVTRDFEGYDGPKPTRTSHFATCPDAHRHRKSRR